MDGPKILEAIHRYRRKFEEMSIEKRKFPHDEKIFIPNDALRHCYNMLDQMEEFVHQGRLEKAFRWLGFIQGVLWVMGFTLSIT